MDWQKKNLPPLSSPWLAAVPSKSGFIQKIATIKISTEGLFKDHLHRSYNFTDSTKMHIPSLFYLGFKAWTDCLTNFSTFFSSLVLNCTRHWALCVNNLYTIPPWTTKKHQKTLSRPLHSKLKKIQGLFKDLLRNLRIFQGKMEFKDFSRLCEPWIMLRGWGLI